MISPRQRDILMAIIEEFMQSAQEVGSTTLLTKHRLGVSPATIRSEMVRLMDEGFLEKSHSSSGRLPTDMALRLYVQDISQDRLSPLDEVEIQQGIFSVRFSQDQLIKQILEILVQKCNSAAFFLSDDDRRYYGVSSLMKYDELRDLKTLSRVLDALEDENLLRTVFKRYEHSTNEDETVVVIGQESGISNLEDCALIFTKVRLMKGKQGHMGIISSKRVDYKQAIPVVSAIKKSVEKSLEAWI